MPRDFSGNSELLRVTPPPRCGEENVSQVLLSVSSTEQRAGWRRTGLSVTPCRHVKKNKQKTNPELALLVPILASLYLGVGVGS